VRGRIWGLGTEGPKQKENVMAAELERILIDLIEDIKVHPRPWGE